MMIRKYMNAFTTRSLLPILRFVLDKKFQRNASKFAIFYVYENPKLLFPFSFHEYFIFLPYECLVYVDIDLGI